MVQPGSVELSNICLLLDPICTVSYLHDPSQSFCLKYGYVIDLDNLLSISDIISLHIPLTEETKNLLNENKLRLIKKSSVIINAARGGVIDENQLAKLLKENKIAGAALDVFNNEPVKKEYAKKFEGIDNLILTPHVGGVTKESNKRVSELIAKKIDFHLSKK